MQKKIKQKISQRAHVNIKLFKNFAKIFTGIFFILFSVVISKSGYDGIEVKTERLEKTLLELKEENCRLRSEALVLTAYDRIKSIAESELNMVVPEERFIISKK